MRTPLRLLALTAVTVGGLALGTASAHAADVPEIPGYDRVDEVADGLVCDGPLGGVLQGLGVNCTPEDNPPFSSAPTD